jgi:hypothetical protein
MNAKPRSYLAAAFNARPLGMPIPPNWFGLLGFGLLGTFLDPGFFLIGAGLEALYLWWLSSNARFRAVVDAQALGGSSEWSSQYESMIARLAEADRRAQADMEEQGASLIEVLTRSGAFPTQLADVRQLVWLHLKLLAARSALQEVIGSASREQRGLEDQQLQLTQRLSQADLDPELKSSLESQLTVIQSRRAAHALASRRCEFVDAEIARLRQQLSLVREQALLATDEGSVARSVDALSASLNEANRWLKDQRELFAGFETFSDEPPPPELLGQRSSASSATSRKKRTHGVSQ